MDSNRILPDKKHVPYLILFLMSLTTFQGLAQSTELKPGPGIGIYPTGTETGIGYRSSKDTRWAIDARFARANLYGKPKSGTWVNEVSLLYRIVYYEKVRFHIGLGGRVDWNFDPNKTHKLGIVSVYGIEAFPFSFQNAGLFFEAAPFYTTAGGENYYTGIRTVAGFVLYFLR